MKLLNLWQNAGESDLKTQYMGHVILLLYSLNFFTDVHFSNIACCYTLLLLLEKNKNNVFWFNITTVWNNLFSFLSAIYSPFQNKQITYCTVFQNKYSWLFFQVTIGILLLWNIKYPSPFLSWLQSINMFFSL